jgi:hypothetical protein
MDLLDLYRGNISHRKVAVFIEHLPPESATMTAIRMDIPEDAAGELLDPYSIPWGMSAQLLASVVDEIRVANYLFVQANSAKGSRTPPAPQPIPRPGVKKPRDKVALTVGQRMSIDPRSRRAGR